MHINPMQSCEIDKNTSHKWNHIHRFLFKSNSLRHLKYFVSEEVAPIMPAADSFEDRKGVPVKLIGSTAKRHKNYVAAWLDEGKSPTWCYYFVIIEHVTSEDPEETFLDSYRVAKHNVVDVDPPPQTYTEAAFQQIPQLQDTLTSFARMVAKCRIQRSRELSNIIAKAIDREIGILMRKQSTAEYRLVDTSVLPGQPGMVSPDHNPDEHLEDETGVAQLAE